MPPPLTRANNTTDNEWFTSNFLHLWSKGAAKPSTSRSTCVAPSAPPVGSHDSYDNCTNQKILEDLVLNVNLVDATTHPDASTPQLSFARRTFVEARMPPTATCCPTCSVRPITKRLKRHKSALDTCARSTRSERPQNHKNDHPRHREMATSPSKEVKTPQHFKTPRYAPTRT